MVLFCCCNSTLMVTLTLTAHICGVYSHFLWDWCLSIPLQLAPKTHFTLRILAWLSHTSFNLFILIQWWICKDYFLPLKECFITLISNCLQWGYLLRGWGKLITTNYYSNQMASPFAKPATHCTLYLSPLYRNWENSCVGPDLAHRYRLPNPALSIILVVEYRCLHILPILSAYSYPEL